MTWDKTEKSIMRRLLIATGFGEIGVLLLSFLSLWVYPDGDSWGLIRTLFQQGVPVMHKAVLVLWVLGLFNFVEPGDSLEKIGESPNASAALVCMCLYCVFCTGG